jgi:hypothetical protein
MSRRSGGSHGQDSADDLRGQASRPPSLPRARRCHGKPGPARCLSIGLMRPMRSRRDPAQPRTGAPEGVVGLLLTLVAGPNKIGVDLIDSLPGRNREVEYSHASGPPVIPGGERPSRCPSRWPRPPCPYRPLQASDLRFWVGATGFEPVTSAVRKATPVGPSVPVSDSLRRRRTPTNGRNCSMESFYDAASSVA